VIQTTGRNLRGKGNFEGMDMKFTCQFQMNVVWKMGVSKGGGLLKGEGTGIKNREKKKPTWLSIYRWAKGQIWFFGEIRFEIRWRHKKEKGGGLVF